MSGWGGSSLGLLDQGILWEQVVIGGGQIILGGTITYGGANLVVAGGTVTIGSGGALSPGGVTLVTGGSAATLYGMDQMLDGVKNVSKGINDHLQTNGEQEELQGTESEDGFRVS